MKYAKSNKEKTESPKMDKDTLKNIKAFGSVVIIKGGSLVDED
jgi:hypothetical protein